MEPPNELKRMLAGTTAWEQPAQDVNSAYEVVTEAADGERVLDTRRPIQQGRVGAGRRGDRRYPGHARECSQQSRRQDPGTVHSPELGSHTEEQVVYGFALLTSVSERSSESFR